MGNQREIRQLSPRSGLAVIVPVRPGRVADVDRILGNPDERPSFYTFRCPAGEPVSIFNLDGRDVNLDPQPFDCVAIQSGGKMWCGYDAFVSLIRELAPHLEDALFYVGDEEDYVDEFGLEGGELAYRRVHSGYYLSVQEFLRSGAARQNGKPISSRG